MANAIPVHSKPQKAKDTGPEVIVHESKAADLLARAQEILDSEAPAQILDEQVNQVGQMSSYGKAQRIIEVPYPKQNFRGEPTGETNICIRIDH
jgi:hypothetical protein